MADPRCETCEGRGWVSVRFDPSPAGVALSPGWMEDVEPCPDCNPNGTDPEEPEWQ